MKFNKWPLLMAFTLMTNGFARAADIFPSKSKEKTYIQVKLNEDVSGKTLVGFRKCKKDESRSKCTVIGKKDFYLVEELDHYQEMAKLKLAGVSAVIVGIGLGIGAAPALYSTEAMSAQGLIADEVATLVFPGTVSGMLSIATDFVNDNINVFYLKDTIKALSDDVLSDQPVATDDIDKNIKLLERILSHIE